SRRLPRGTRQVPLEDGGPVVKMLGRLLHTAASSLSPHNLSRPQASLESTTEEAHTHSLLYPEASALHYTQHQLSPLHHGSGQSTAAAAASFDDRGGLDIHGPRDIRIIIAQDANTRSHKPEVLYDSQPTMSLPVVNASIPSDPVDAGDAKQRVQAPDSSQDATSPRLGNSAFGTKHDRHRSLTWNSSIAIDDAALAPTSSNHPEPWLGSAFGNSRLRASKTRPGSSGNETAQGKVAREGKEDTEALLGCMFGATGFRLVSSTKLHIRPATPSRAAASASVSPIAAEPSSPKSFPKRRTPLTRSVTAEDILAGLVSGAGEGSTRYVPQPDRPSMLITRLFSVDLPEISPSTDVENEQTPNAESFMKDTRSSPCPQKKPIAGTKGPEKAHHAKVPMYAVSIVLQLPSNHRRPSTPSARREQSSANTLQGRPLSQSPSRHETNADWGMSYQGQQESMLSPAGAESDIDRHLEYVLGQWDVVMRALSSLERVVKDQLQDMLRLSNVTSTFLLPSQPFSRVPSSDELLKLTPKGPKKPVRYSLQLPPRALEQSEPVAKAAGHMVVRIAVGLRSRKVVAGQGRWGVWREEARWVGRWAGGKEQNFFFFNLLTAFLGNHTEWLGSLGPSWHRRRRTQQQRVHSRDESFLPHRTVIVSVDKMAARRLIFLLSAFLPATRGLNGIDLPPRPASSTFNHSYSQSPPSGIPVLREQSLRRTINRRARGKGHGGQSTGTHGRSVSFSTQGTVKADTHPDPHEFDSSQRKGSTVETRTILGASLPIPSNGSKTRKSSTTTTSTITLEAALPVPHFASSSTVTDLSAELRPRSNGSLASLTLRHNLDRAESSGLSNSTDSQQNSTWGSMLSGFWSNRRGSTTEDSDLMASSQEGLGITGLSKGGGASAPLGKLERMVNEVSGNHRNEGGLELDVKDSPTPGSIQTAQDQSQQALSLVESTPAQDIPKRPRSRRAPLKLSIDNEDGVIDVELPATSSFSSFGSPISSGNECLTAASSFNEHAPTHVHAPAPKSSHADSTTPDNVVGWLKKYHEDFALQAIRPYDGLKDDIKRSMHAEPSPPTPPTTPGAKAIPDDKWKDVCTTLIADATDFSITRLRLRRRLIRRDPSSALPPDSPQQTNHSGTTLHVVEEDLIEEPIMDLDPTLIDAIERLLVQSGRSSSLASTTHSRASSRAASPQRRGEQRDRLHPHRRTASATSTSATATAIEVTMPAFKETTEVPRSECRNLVMSALEE
ncbi:MAG: hypothetical protein LQ347_006728, partial [Umbilicaria vellea]